MKHLQINELLKWRQNGKELVDNQTVLYLSEQKVSLSKKVFCHIPVAKIGSYLSSKTARIPQKMRTGLSYPRRFLSTQTILQVCISQDVQENQKLIKIQSHSSPRVVPPYCHILLPLPLYYLFSTFILVT